MTRDSSLEHSVWASQIKKATKRLWPDGRIDSLEEAINLEKFLRTYPVEIRQKVRDFNPATVDEAVDLLNRFDPQLDTKKSNYKGEQPSSRPYTGSWKPKWREQWKKPSTPASYKPEEMAQVPPPYAADSTDGGEEQRKEEPQGKSYHQSNSRHHNSHQGKGGRQDTTCRRCGGKGHWERQCPSAPSSVNWVSLGGCQEDIRSGTIDGRDVKDIIIDAGSAASIVASDMLPRNPKFQGYMWLAGFDSVPKRYQTVTIPLKLNNQAFTATMAVVPRDTLRGNSALVGRNVPGLTLKQTICGDKKNLPDPQTTPTDTQPVMAVQTRAQRAKEDQKRAQEDQESEESGLTPTPLFEEAENSDPEVHPDPNDSEDDSDEEDNSNTEDHTSPTTGVEEESDPLPQEYPHLEPNVPHIPLGAESFAKAQEEDQELVPLWDLARTSPGRFKVKGGLLYRMVIDELDQSKDLLVVLRVLTRTVWEYVHCSPMWATRRSDRSLPGTFSGTEWLRIANAGPKPAPLVRGATRLEGSRHHSTLSP